jgi:excisionase family DNA binding protein
MSNSEQVKSHEVSNQEHLPQVLTVEEAAKLLRVGVGHLESSVKRGEIPGVRRIGRNLRFHRSTLLRWLDGETGMAQASHGRTHDPIDEEAWDSDA